jgi:hypothetical protein
MRKKVIAGIRHIRKNLRGVIPVKKAVIIFLVALIALILILPGCGPGETPEGETPETGNPETKIPEVETPDEEEPLEYEIVGDLNLLPEKVRRAVEELKAERGYFVFSEPEFNTGDDVFLLISSGEKATGGYRVVLDTLNASKSNLKVNVEETEPKERNAVIQVLTYPLLVIKLNGTPENYTVQNTENEIFEELVYSDENGGSKQLERKTGIYSGQIDSNFVEIKIDGQAKAFMLPQGLSGILTGLSSGDKVNLCYYENEYGQLIIEEIAKE